MPLSPRKHLGRLELLAEIYVGGNEEFFRGRDTRNGQDVGVQILPFTQGLPMRFEAKHHRAAQLRHRNILEIRGLRAKSQISYIVTEPFEGDSLAAMLKHGPLAIPEAVDFADQIVQALEAAHAADVIHGNLSAGHILVDRHGNLKVFGFSLAGSRPADDEEGQYEYYSPEGIRGETVDERSDVFSFGSTLYEMLAGNAPFRRYSSEETAHAVQEEWADALPEKVPDDLAEVVARCLAKDPRERFQTAAELKSALRNLVVQSLADPVTELSPRTRRFQGWLHLAKAQWELGTHNLVERTAQLVRMPRGWTAVALAAVAILLAVDLFVRVRGGYTREAPVFQRLTFRRGPIIRARFADHGKSVAYTARFEDAPQTSYVTTAETGAVRDLKLPPDSSMVAVSSNGNVAVRMRDGSLASLPLKGGDLVNQATGVLDADFSPGGDALAVVRFDSAASNYVLEYPVGHSLVRSPTPMDLVRVSPKGDPVAYSKLEGPRKSLWIVNRSGVTRMLADLGPGDANRSLAWSADGKEIWFGATSAKERGIIQTITLDGKRRVVDWMPETQLDDIGPKGEALVETFRGWSGTRVRGTAENRDTDISWFGENVSAGLSTDGNRIFVTESGAASGGASGVYMRSRRGTAPVRLCDGSLVNVSPNGEWISVYRPGPQPRYVLAPSGGGKEKAVEIPTLEGRTAAVIAWLRGGRYLVWGNRPGGPKQHFLWNPGMGELRAVTPPGSSVGLASDDGVQLLTASPNGSLYVFSIDGDKFSPAQGLRPSDQLLRWSPDDKTVFVGSLAENRRDFSIFKINVSSGARTLWKSVEPDVQADSAAPAAITPDGNTYAYTYFRAQSELFLARGLK